MQHENVEALSLRPVDRVVIEAAPLVFVGYGVSAPERGWDDYKGVDLRGKVAVFLINDPDFEAGPDDAVSGRFGGNAATYYARWTYKYEEAARRGAIGALIVHETPGAGYGWSTAVAPGGEGFDVVRADPARDKVLLQAWLHRDTAVAIFGKAGLDFEALKAQARKADFKPVVLGGATSRRTIRWRIRASRVATSSRDCRESKRPAETVMIGAHWDAYGIGEPDASGDRIRRGAADDALGVAGVLEVARAFAKGRARPLAGVRRWTAEERGLLGSSSTPNTRSTRSRRPWRT